MPARVWKAAHYFKHTVIEKFHMNILYLNKKFQAKKIVESNGVNVYKDQVVGICPIAISQKGNSSKNILNFTLDTFDYLFFFRRVKYLLFTFTFTVTITNKVLKLTECHVSCYEFLFFYFTIYILIKRYHLYSFLKQRKFGFDLKKIINMPEYKSYKNK